MVSHLEKYQANRYNPLTMFKLLRLLPVFLLPAFAFSSSNLSIDPEQYLHRTWNTRDGLIQNTVNCMVRDGRGYMWLGTDSGLVRFDGLQFKTFRNINKVTCLLIHSSGEIWIGTYGSGVFCYDSAGNCIKKYSEAAGLPSNFIQTMAEDKSGNVWLGTSAKGIIRFKDNVFTLFTASEGLSNNHVSSLLADSQGSLWIGTENGLNRMTDGKFAVFTVKEGLPANNITTMCREKKGSIWVGTINGLSIINHWGKQNKVRPVEPLINHLIYSLLNDSNGVIWIASDKGLYYAIPLSANAAEGTYSIRQLMMDDGFLGYPVISLFEDIEGTLWYGTEGKGFGNLYKSQFKFYTVNHGLSSQHVTSVYQDHKGDIWIGTWGGGLNRFKLKEGKFKIYSRKDGLNSRWVTSIYGDRDGNIWIGTTGGLCRFKNGSFKTFTTSDGLSGSSIRALVVDSSGNLWIGTHGKGLNLYKPREGKFQAYDIDHGLFNPFVSAITEDVHGNLWIGTHKGLYRFRDGRFKCFTTKDGLSSDMIYDIYADSDGDLWIATHGGGLNYCKNGTFTRIEIQEVPFKNHVSLYKILKDNRGHLWLTSPNGIFCILSNELERYEAGKTKDIDYYHFREGLLKTAVFSGGFQPAGWKTADGSLWLPTVKGMTVIPASENMFNRGSHQQVHIEKIVVNNVPKDLKTTAPYRFSAGTKKIEFYFNAPNFKALEMVRYTCRLKGASYDFTGHLWDERDEIRIISSNKEIYHDLPAGHYMFTISINAGSSQGSSVDFYINRSFSETLWFYLLIFIFGLIAAWGVFWFIKRRPKKKWIMPIWANEEKYKTFKLTNRESKKYLKKLIEVMEREKPYLDPELTLPRLAKKINVGKEVLSQVINRELYLNFNAFLNRYRVEEAKKKLRDPKENRFVVLKIAFDVGFNSKSSFNAVFRKMTGMSPSQYREMVQKK